ncbi:hypothetical protein AYO20_09087 [Fonsecaea nubica]|uniref:Uncharacterized protein n=1 Tax=Fonsecaea nubica TaxID=856822 RepID=A0A178CKW1_9EURO|nr:hypothetical protein AYO20_09087 [Fonsecaea nubica]OAL29703.1 hypothetical protein AYO20_09087 [Fonsecaea nubica]
MSIPSYRTNISDSQLVPFSVPQTGLIPGAIVKVAGEVDVIEILANRDENEAIEAVRKTAIATAIANGADEQDVKIVKIKKIPLQYVTNKATRFAMKAVGSLRARDDAVQNGFANGTIAQAQEVDDDTTQEATETRGDRHAELPDFESTVSEYQILTDSESSTRRIAKSQKMIPPKEVGAQARTVVILSWSCSTCPCLVRRVYQNVGMINYVFLMPARHVHHFGAPHQGPGPLKGPNPGVLSWAKSSPAGFLVAGFLVTMAKAKDFMIGQAVKTRRGHRMISREASRIVAAGVLAGELSLCSAFAAGHLVMAHVAHNRRTRSTCSSGRSASSVNTHRQTLKHLNRPIRAAS